MRNLDAWLEPPEPEPTGECSDCEGEDLDCPECGGKGEVELQMCDSCNSYSCHCDADYDAWQESYYD